MHKTWIYLAQTRYGAQCKCGQRSGLVQFRWQAEDWVNEHREAIERVHARHRSHSPSLTTTLRHYREAADSPDCTPDQQALWKQMADEIESRLADTNIKDQLPLW